MVEIARRDGVGKQYVSRLIRLAFSHPSGGADRGGCHRLSLPRKVCRPAVFDIPVGWRRKSEPSDLRSGLSTPLQQRSALPIYKLNPPPKVRTERNLQNSRLNPTRPVLRATLGAGFRPNARFHAEKQRIPKTEDSLAERGEFELPVTDL